MHFLTALTLLSGASALPSARSSYAVKETHIVPRSWIATGPAEGTGMINMQLGLKQSNENLVEEYLAKSSDPSHRMFRQHLSAEQLTEMTRPSSETLNAVTEWLDSYGIGNLNFSPAKDWIYVRIPVQKAEELLQTKYSKFRHAVSGEELVRTAEWSLPLNLHDHIDVIQPTTSFFRSAPLAVHPLASDQSWSIEEAQKMFAPQTQSKFTAADSPDSYPPLSSVCNATFVTPACIRTLYRTLNYETKAEDKNNIAITNYLNETNYRNDIFKFLDGWRNQTVAQSAYTFKRIIVANGSDDQGPYTAAQIAAGQNEEGNLDAEAVLSVAWPTPLWAYNIGGEPPFTPDLATPTDTNEPYLNFINYVSARSAVPLVVTSSYGDDEQTVPASYARAVCRGFQNLGARGSTVLVSSGDAGVGPNGKCFSNTDPSKATFLPAFPAGCPYVTAVGATYNFNPEVAVQRFASGGGFSNYFARPSWQNNVTDKYIASLGGAYKGLYNPNGRGYPDVAAQGNADVIVWNSRVITIGGTSASSPTFAAVLALVNDALLANGKPSLGFINPWLYKTGYQGLNDIVFGSSYGCNTTGFPAQIGWDAVTGWGTPDFPKLLALAQQGGYRS